MSRLSPRAIAILENQITASNLPVPNHPKRRDNEESRSQQAFVSWWDGICEQYDLPPRVLFAIPNGHKRGKVIGAILKREGVRAGVSDLMVMVARGRYHGLFIEMKNPTGTPTDEQKSFIAEAQRQGYAAGCAFSTQDAVRFIECYLRGETFL